MEELLKQTHRRAHQNFIYKRDEGQTKTHTFLRRGMEEAQLTQDGNTQTR